MEVPFHAGLLRSRSLPKTMRHLPLFLSVSAVRDDVVLPRDHLCSPRRPPAHPAHPVRNHAWRISINRRMSVESVNAAFKGGFVNMVRGFFRVFGLTKMTALLGFTAAAVNVDRIRSYEAKLAENTPTPIFRARRRKGTWQALIGEYPIETAERATGPPG